MNDNYLESAKERFGHYKILGEKTFEQVEDESLFYQFNEDSNSIATIVKHMHGNMLSRWTDFLTTDGEKEWRQRDAEFENDVASREEMMRLWTEGWTLVFSTLDKLTAEDLSKTVTIRKEKHTVVEAVNRQLTHYSYHVGQIVYLGKILAENGWTSLSIPRNKSDRD